MDYNPMVEPGGSNGLPYLFSIKEMNSFPETISLEKIQPVIDMSMQGHAKLHDLSKVISIVGTPTNLGGQQTRSFYLLTYGNAVGADQQIVVPINHNFVLWGIKINFATDGAGAAALNNKFVSFEIKLYVQGTGTTKYFCTFQCNSAIQQYAPGSINTPQLDRNAIQIIPAGAILICTFWVQEGSNFPANTAVNYALTGQVVPVGAPIPLGV